MRKAIVYLMAVLISEAAFAQTDSVSSRLPTVSSGTIRRFANFPSNYLPSRNVDVWLPKGYDPARKYAVLYMHDGQMLFDSIYNWNQQEWQVDEIITRLLDKKQIRECIVVAVWNNGLFRLAEFFPQKALEFIPESPTKDSLVQITLKGAPSADNYLKFLTSELKPFIDKTFSTKTDAQNTFIAGSSMGGLISLYAICEYPSVFGGAGCLSTHWIGDFNVKSGKNAEAIRHYLAQHLAPPAHHKIYFDFGTTTVDQYYEPYQLKVDSLMKAKGYTSKNWMTRKFEGEPHTERAWAKRLDIPLVFLMGK